MTSTLLKAINWKLALFTGLMLPVLVSLGFWQLQRESEKLLLQDQYEKRSGDLPISLADLSNLNTQGQAFMPVTLQGYFDNTRYFLLDNRTHEGQQGVEVISPFITSDGQVVLVNRGWLARGSYRTELPDVVAVYGEVIITGNVYVPQGEPFMLAEETSFDDWPRLLQALDVELMYEELQIKSSEQAISYTLRLRDSMPGGFGHYWQAINMAPEKHRGYAIQWFSMAVALTLLFIYSFFKSYQETERTSHG